MANSATRYTLTTVKISVHPKDENPFFSEQATYVSLDDEAAGAFLVLSQYPDDVAPGIAKMKINIDEFPLIVEAVNKLLDQKLPD